MLPHHRRRSHSGVGSGRSLGATFSTIDRYAGPIGQAQPDSHGEMMTRFWPTLTCFASLAAVAANAQTPRESRLTSARASQVADSILRLMTLEEKIGQLNQLPGKGTPTGPRAPQGGEALVRSGALDRSSESSAPSTRAGSSGSRSASPGSRSRSSSPTM